jgi:hypothetical protein
MFGAQRQSWFNANPASGGLTATYLVVAAGGSGGSRIGGGGGAGGFLTGSVSLTAAAVYTITVGVGGAAVTSTPGHIGNNGGDSEILGTGITTVSATGGGGCFAGSALAGEDVTVGDAPLFDGVAQSGFDVVLVQDLVKPLGAVFARNDLIRLTRFWRHWEI